MRKLFGEILRELGRGRDAVLCTILTSSGSCPRGAGSRMAVFEDGRTAGTVGGGVVEQKAAEQAKRVLETGENATRGYRLRPDEVRDIGMICGGDVTVYFQLFRHTDPRQIRFLERLDGLFDAGVNTWLIMRIDGDRLPGIYLYDEETGLQFAEDGAAPDLGRLLRQQSVYLKGGPAWYAEPVVRASRLYLFGGGHVGQALCPLLTGIGFDVTVYDDRPGIEKLDAFRTARRVIVAEYGEMERYIQLKPADYAVIMTPGHRSDYELLRLVLPARTAYTGCIGSRHKVAATRERLLADGLTEADCDRIHSPIGLPIGAETPEEIAVSVAAELIRHRHGNG